MKNNNDYPSAIRDFTSAISINPYFPEAYNYRSKAKWEVDDIEGSREDYKMYLNIYE
jgi:lipoprotein NlpI